MLKNLLDPSWVAALFRRELPGLRSLEFKEDNVRVLDTRVGEQWIGQYAVATGRRGEGEGTELWLTLFFFPCGGFESAAGSLSRRLRKRTQNLDQFTRVSPRQRMIIVPFPMDPKLKSLPEASDPTAALTFLRQKAPEQFCSARSIRVEPLRYVPTRRCQLLYRVGFDDGGAKGFLGKVFRDDRGLQLVKTLNEVHDWFLREASPGLSAVRCLGYFPEWNMVLQEQVPGETLHTEIRRKRWNEGQFQAAARSIATLHRLPPSSGRTHDVGDELQLIRRSLDRLSDCGLADEKFELAFRTVCSRASGLDPSRTVTVHRDFYDKQLLVTDREATLIDLDTMATGFAEIDVANFCAHIRLRALQGWYSASEAAGLEWLFKREYVSTGGELDLDRVSFFEAASFFRLACKYRLRPCDTTVANGLLRFADEGASLSPRANGTTDRQEVRP